MKTSIAVVWCLCASMARADFTYLAQSGSATVSYAIPTATPPNDSVSWSAPAGFADYNTSIVANPSSGLGFFSSDTIVANFHPTLISLVGQVQSVGMGIPVSGTATGTDTRSVMFRNDTAQVWPIVGKLVLNKLTIPPSIVTTGSIACTFVGSDGTNLSFSPITETDFTGQVKPGVTYTLSITANESVSGSLVQSGPTFLNAANFNVTIGEDLPEPTTLVLALAGVLVAILLRRT